MTQTKGGIAFAVTLGLSQVLALLALIGSSFAWFGMPALALAFAAFFVGAGDHVEGRRLPAGLIGLLNLGGVIGTLVYPWIVAFSVKPWDSDLVRLCGDVVGRENITDLQIRTSNIPPALLCYPHGWGSWPVSATPSLTSAGLVIALLITVGLTVAAVWNARGPRFEWPSSSA